MAELVKTNNLPALPSRVKEYVQASRAPNTHRAYRADWAHYTAWCQDKDLCPLPADPETIVLYISYLAETRKPSTIQRRLTTIRTAHKAQGEADPTENMAVTTVMDGIRRTKGTAPKKAKALTWQDMLLLLESLPDTIQGKRDKALLLLGFAGALRRSELVAIDVEDLERRDDGYVLTVRRSKTDQTGEGTAIGIPEGLAGSCPVEAIDAWIGCLPSPDGALFRAVRGSRIGDRLSPRAVSEVVKRVTKILPGSYSGHSLRRGLATSAARAGVRVDVIQKQTRHKSREVLQGYIEDGSLFVENAAYEVMRRRK